jgi:hypothetical protein
MSSHSLFLCGRIEPEKAVSNNELLLGTPTAEDDGEHLGSLLHNPRDTASHEFSTT